MTLRKQLIITITVLMTLLLAGNLVVSVFNARNYFNEQLRVHATETATSLGFTIASAAQEKDIAQLNTMLDVMIDRGYYHRITYLNLEKEVVVEKQSAIQVEGVPAWFIDLVALPASTGRADVISGWFRLGELIVVAHPGYAYRDLWKMFQQQLWLFAVMAGLSYSLGWLGLKYLLRPLRQVEYQAEAISRREFYLQQNLPKACELRRVVVAMNTMVQKIRDGIDEQANFIESLHQQAHLDPLTKLSNRRDFDARYNAFVTSEAGDSTGLILLIQIENMHRLNTESGRQAGDQCLLDVATTLREETKQLEESILSRRAGADFCIFVPFLQHAEIAPLLQRIVQSLRDLHWFRPPCIVRFSVGAAFSSGVSTDNQLLSNADTALRQAQADQSCDWKLYEPASVSNGGAMLSADQWQLLLQEALASRSLQFHYQPVIAADGSPLYVEVLSRLDDGEQLHNAGVFLPIVERLNMGVAIDQLVLELLQEAHVAPTVKLCVNLSPCSVRDPAFNDWLETFLIQHPEFARQLIIEVSEHKLVPAQSSLVTFGMMLSRCGTRLSLDQFGCGVSALDILHKLPLDSVKIDRCFIQSIASNPDNRFFVGSLIQIAHSCDVNILAEGIESDLEWQTLLSLGADGGQGCFLGKPCETIQEII